MVKKGYIKLDGHGYPELDDSGALIYEEREIEERQIPYHRPYKIDINFDEIIDSGIYTNDIYCRELEKKIGKMYNCSALVCSNGSMGLLIASTLLQLEGISLPSFNWFSDRYIVEYFRDKWIHYTDIDPKSWLGLSEQTDIRLHTFGNSDPYWYDNCIYDGTHALGTKFKSLGLATVISFAPTKMVTAGEGGVILSKEPNEHLKELRDKCSRMSEFHAKIGLEYLKYLQLFMRNKKKIYDYYKAILDGQFQEIPYDSNYNTIGMLTKLEIPDSIETRKYYEPLKKGLKNTDYVYDNIVCLPSWYGVDYKLVVERIIEYNNKKEYNKIKKLYFRKGLVNEDWYK